MKQKIILTIVVSILIFLSFGFKTTSSYLLSQEHIPKHYKDIFFLENNYQIPSPKEYRHQILPNAISYLLPSNELDLIEFTLFLPMQNIPQNPKEVALYALLNQTYFTSGTMKLTPEQITDSLDFIAASMSIALQPYQTTIQFEGFNEHFSDLLSLLTEIITTPRFDTQQVELAKQKLKQSIIENSNQPRGLLNRQYPKLMYQDHPSNWDIDLNILSNLSSTDLNQFVSQLFINQEQNIIFGIAGSFNSQEMLKKLQKFTKKLLNKITIKKPLTVKQRIPYVESKNQLVNHEFTQATIQIGYPGIQRPHPDYYPLTIIHHILGGGLQSKLSQKIRSENGLAYTIYSSVESNYYQPSTSYFFLQTKTQSSFQALDLLFQELNKKNLFTQKELKEAKAILVSNLYSVFKNNFTTAVAFAQSEYWGRSLTHFKDYSRKLNEITLSKIKITFKKYFKDQKPSILLIGPQSILEKNSSTQTFEIIEFFQQF